MKLQCMRLAKDHINATSMYLLNFFISIFGRVLESLPVINLLFVTLALVLVFTPLSLMFSYLAQYDGFFNMCEIKCIFSVTYMKYVHSLCFIIYCAHIGMHCVKLQWTTTLAQLNLGFAVRSPSFFVYFSILDDCLTILGLNSMLYVQYNVSDNY